DHLHGPDPEDPDDLCLLGRLVGDPRRAGRRLRWGRGSRGQLDAVAQAQRPTAAARRPARATRDGPHGPEARARAGVSAGAPAGSRALVQKRWLMHDVDGVNAGYARLLLDEYLDNPESVPPEWRALFESGESDLLRGLPGVARLLERLPEP